MLDVLLLCLWPSCMGIVPWCWTDPGETNTQGTLQEGMYERRLIESSPSWKAGSPSISITKWMKQANPYVKLVVSGVNHSRMCTAESLYWQCKPSCWLCKLQCGIPEWGWQWRVWDKQKRTWRKLIWRLIAGKPKRDLKSCSLNS